MKKSMKELVIVLYGGDEDGKETKEKIIAKDL